MKTTELAVDFIVVFIITFVVSSLVTYIYSLLAHSLGVFDWSTAFVLAITFGIVFPWFHYRERKKLSK